jgi:transcriptional regulator with XRE-family HTH domain
MRSRRIDGPLIRNMRELAGISITRFAREIDVSDSHLSRIERDLIGASPETTDRIARRLGATISEITISTTEQVA